MIPTGKTNPKQSASACFLLECPVDSGVLFNDPVARSFETYSEHIEEIGYIHLSIGYYLRFEANLYT
jgi:hypothetical protein